MERLFTVLFDYHSPLTEEEMINQERESKKIKFPPGLATKAAEGDATAQLEMGKIFSTASSLQKNCDMAFDWLSRSAEQGNMEAQFRLGDIYALGHGATKSLSDAYTWYTKAAIQGYKKALIRIHNLYQEDIKMHCRGQINSEEEEWASEKFKKDNGIRELNEYRMEQKKALLNGAINYYTEQFKKYQSSNQDDSAVQLNLAFLYQHGYGVRKYTKWAFRYYTLAAEQGDVNAQYNLGALYEKHLDIKFNYRHAFKWYTESAQGGSRVSQRSLAYFHLKGLATDIDYDIALFWYTKAAEAGDSGAQVSLGKLYRKGEHSKQDLSLAVKLYSLAARQGNITAQNCLSQLHQRGVLSNIKLKQDISEYAREDSMNSRLRTKLSADIAKLVDLHNFKQLTELGKRAFIGDGQSMYEIGLAYLNGDKEFNQDEDTGIKWVKNAAHAKHKDAQLAIANLYKNGDIVKQDYTKAGVWYRDLAKKKDVTSQCNLGIMYNEGLGVREDPLEASKWFIWAADQGNSDAQYNLGMLRLDGRGLRQDKEDAVDWFYKSVLQKNVQASCVLGDVYFHGRFKIAKNTERGLILLEFAAKNGYINAQKKIENMHREGREKDRNMEKFIECYTIAANSGNSEAQYTLAIRHLHSNDWNNAYRRFKQAKDEGYGRAAWMFQIPAQCDPKIKDYSKVLNMFIYATQEKIDDLTYHIGFLYEHGVNYSGKQHIQINYVKARDWYLTASEYGDARADYRLGMMYEDGNGVERSHEKALEYHEKASRRDNGDASFKLATMCLNEYSITHYHHVHSGIISKAPIQSLLRAYHHYQKASIMGHKDATELLQAFKYENENTSPDFLEKVMMLEAATEEGYTGLQYELGVMYKKNDNNPQALKWLSLAAKIGVTDAYYMLGVLYENGEGTEKNYKKAANLYQDATEKEHESACYRLARLYQYGKGVKRDYLMAYHFYKKAADLGHAKAYKVLNITLETKTNSNAHDEACFFNTSSQDYRDSLSMCRYVAEKGDTEVQFKVGFAYEYSLTEPNHAGAHKWYSMAAINSHTEAMYRLGSLYERGVGVHQDYERAIQLYKKVYQQKSGDALYRLAIAFHYGNGVEVNWNEAIKYYTLAAELGNPEYQCDLGRKYEYGDLGEKNLLEAIKWYTKAYMQGYDNISSKLYAMYQNKSYEHFFHERLVRILSVATCGYFRLNEAYNIGDFGGINNRIGSLYVFGHGIEKNLNIAWNYFSKKYDNHPELNISNFFILNQRSLSTSQLHSILLAFEGDEAFMNQLGKEEIYNLGMTYYDGVVQTQSIGKKNKLESHTPTDDQDNDDPNQDFLLEKDHSRAFTYLKKAADKNHNKALLQLKIMRRHGYDASGNSVQGHAYSDSAEELNIEEMEYLAVVYHTHEGVQNFPKAMQWYRRLQSTLNEYLVYNDRKIINQQVYLGLGLLYEYGDGVRQDYKKALRCYKILMGYNRALSLHRQGLIHYYGKGASVDYDESFKLFEKASHGGTWSGKKVVFVYDKYDFLENSSQSNLVYSIMDRQQVAGENHYYLGLVHKNGQGTPLDNVKAQYHFKKAFLKGCIRAKYEIED